jgi:chorismate mutase/prephenate dehydratase
MYKSQTLDNIRQKIDAIDNTIHDLLMERAALASSIAAEKRKRGMPVVHPAREARMVRRLLSRHKGGLPKQAVTRIWRELVSAVSMLQSGLTAQFYSHQGRSDDLKIVTDYFGSILPVRRGEDMASVIGAVANKTADFAIIPKASNAQGQDYWLPSLLKALDDDVEADGVMPISIVQSMPFIVQAADKDDIDGQYLILARTYFESSEDDFSYIALRSDQPFDDADVTQALREAALNVVESVVHSDGDMHYRLLRVDGFVDRNVSSVAKLQDLLGSAHSVYAIGGFPKPIYV